MEVTPPIPSGVLMAPQFYWFSRLVWQNIRKVPFLSLSARHSPESVLDVQLAEEYGSFVSWAGGHCKYHAVEGIPQLVHGFAWGCVLVGKLVHRLDCGILEAHALLG